MYYCNGERCSRHNKCVHHKSDISGKLQQQLDMSIQGTGHAGIDENGKPFCKIEFWCGDEAVDYRYFEPYISKET